MNHQKFHQTNPMVSGSPLSCPLSVGLSLDFLGPWMPAWLWYSQSRVATPWGWKNLGESIFRFENRSTDPIKTRNRWPDMPRIQQNPSEFFVHYLGPGEPFWKSGMAEEEVGPKKTEMDFCQNSKLCQQCPHFKARCYVHLWWYVLSTLSI